MQPDCARCLLLGMWLAGRFFERHAAVVCRTFRRDMLRLGGWELDRPGCAPQLTGTVPGLWMRSESCRLQIYHSYTARLPLFLFPQRFSEVTRDTTEFAFGGHALNGVVDCSMLRDYSLSSR